LTMTETDLDLLRRYAREHAEDAFAEIVGRHLGLVHSAAFRQVHSLQLAEEIAQSVFTDLARTAHRLAPDTVLTAWLYQVTRRTAIDVIRRESRRELREQIATEINAMNAPANNWTNIEPLLDEAMDALGETDRVAVLLRYFENKSLRQVGQTLGTSDDAAQKRVSRAVERLREFFTERGVTVGASGLVVVLSAHAVHAAPVGLAVKISTAAALAANAIASTTFATATKTIAMSALQKTLIAAIVVAGVTTPWIVQHQARLALRDENQFLQQQIAKLQSDNGDLEGRLTHANSSLVLRLPAPPVRSGTPSVPPPPEDWAGTNLYARLKDNSAKLTIAQVEPYLNASHRSAASLLAAYRTTGDPRLLEEAMQKYPDDPQVAFEAAFKKDGAPEQRRQWLEAFKRSAADNALPNYLSALEYFKAGRADQAVQELIAASGKQQFQDYTLDRMQNDEEAYLAAGYPIAEAKTIPAWQLLLPQLRQVKDLGVQMVDLASSYQQAGDPVSAQNALQMAANLGQRYANNVAGETQVSRLVGMWVEKNALNSMDPNSPYGESGQTVKDRLDYLAQQNAQMKQINGQVEALQPLMSDQDWISYKDRWRIFGEEAAAKWLINKYEQK
jgi:RNA polymerase sigma factor (sigma-70 family)